MVICGAGSRYNNLAGCAAIKDQEARSLESLSISTKRDAIRRPFYIGGEGGIRPEARGRASASPGQANRPLDALLFCPSNPLIHKYKKDAIWRLFYFGGEGGIRTHVRLRVN